MVVIGTREHRRQQRGADPLALSRRINAHEGQVPVRVRRMMFVEQVEHVRHPCGTRVVSGAVQQVAHECLTVVFADQWYARWHLQRRARPRACRVHVPMRPARINEACVEDGCAAAPLSIVRNHPSVDPVIDERTAQCGDDLVPFVVGGRMGVDDVWCGHGT